MEKKEKDLNQEIDMEKETVENLEESEAKTSEQENSNESENLEQTDETEAQKTEESTIREETPQKRKIGKNQLIIMIVVGILAIASLFFLTRDKLVLNPYKVNIGEDVYITLDQLVNEDKTNVELDTLKIKHPFDDKDKYEMSPTGLVSTVGLGYLDAGTYEVEVYSTEKDNLSKTVKIEVVDKEAPEFVDFKDKIEVGQGQKFEWTDFFNAQDKSKVEISVNAGRFDVETLGTYNIVVRATDTAGNYTEKEAEVVVKERKLTSIEATYKGSKKEGTEINQDSDITVIAHFEDGTSEEVTGWQLEKPETLVADGTSTLKIKYKDSACDLTVKCSTESEAGYKASCGEIAYEELARNGNKHFGERVKFYGRVVQVQDNIMRIATRPSAYGTYREDIVYVSFLGPIPEYDGEGATGYYNYDREKFLEDDMVTFYGEATGDITYTSVLGASITIPSVTARYIDR